MHISRSASPIDHVDKSANGDPAPPMILNDTVEEVLAPQEALGRSVLQLSADVIFILKEHRNPQKTTQKIAVGASRLIKSFSGDEVEIFPVIERVEQRVYGCQVAVGCDMHDLAQTSTTILKALIRIKTYVIVIYVNPF